MVELVKRESLPPLSSEGERAMERYVSYLRDEQGLAADTVRGYLSSDLRQFASYCESFRSDGLEELREFSISAAAAMPAIEIGTW